MLIDGDEMLIWCRGGRAMVKRQTFPPLLEIEDEGGRYVLDDLDPIAENWTYVFVADSGI